MISLNEEKKIQFIFNKFNNTIANHTMYTVNHEPIFKQKLIEKYKTAENINTVLMTLNNLPSKSYYSDKDLFKIVDYNLKFKNKFMAKIEKINLGNNITFKYASTALTSIYGTGDFHPEAPFQINIFVKNKEVGTFNFIILNNTSNRKLLINLV